MEKGSEALYKSVYQMIKTQLRHNFPDLSKEDISERAEEQTRQFLDSKHTQEVKKDLDDTQEFKAIKS